MARVLPYPRATIAVAIFTAFTVWITWRAKAIETSLADHSGQAIALEGKPAPEFRLISLDGRTVSAADFRGKSKLVVTFWASWCDPCRAELPMLAKLYRQTHHSAADYAIVAISTDNDRADAQRAATQMNLPFTVLLDPMGAASRMYRVDAIPELFVIDKSGNVIDAQVGFNPALVIRLARQLGIKNYNPIAVEIDRSAGH